MQSPIITSQTHKGAAKPGGLSSSQWLNKGEVTLTHISALHVERKTSACMDMEAPFGRSHPVQLDVLAAGSVIEAVKNP